MPSGFVTICPKKEVELGADRLLHRADHAEELRREIEFAASGAEANQYAHLPGGAVRAINPSNSMTLAEGCNLIAVFKGSLANRDDLLQQAQGCAADATNAALVLALYAAHGLDMLPRLSGQYAFCLYDSKQARVLAARDHSGAVPLLEGRTASGSLIIACGTFLPEGTTQMVEIQPGEYKYGWNALPRQFKCGAKIVSGRASCDYGIRRRSIDAYSAPPAAAGGGRRSMDIPLRHHQGGGAPRSHSYGHTPGRYMPPHATAAGAGAGAGAAYGGRQRAMSLDGAAAAQARSPAPVPVPPHQQHHGHAGGTPGSAGRRRSETNVHRQHPAPPPQHWVPKAPMAAPAKPAPIQTPAASQAAAPQADEASTPTGSVASTPSSGGSEHRRRRRHHRRSRNNGDGAAAAEDAGDRSETGSAASPSTHDSSAVPPAGGSRSGGRAAPKAPLAQAAAPCGGGASGSGGAGFKRNGSCSELSRLLAAQQALAC